MHAKISRVVCCKSIHTHLLMISRLALNIVLNVVAVFEYLLIIISVGCHSYMNQDHVACIKARKEMKISPMNTGIAFAIT